MFVSLTFVLFILCIYTYFKHKICKVCNIVYVKYKVYLLFMQQPFLCVPYNIRKAILCKRAVFRVPCLHHVPEAGRLHLYIVKFCSCLYIVRFFRINIQYYCIFSVYLCTFRAFSVCLYSNYAVLCGKIEHFSKCAGFVQTFAQTTL